MQLAFADAGYQGPRVASASSIRVEIVRKPEGQVGFAVHARETDSKVTYPQAAVIHTPKILCSLCSMFGRRKRLKWLRKSPELLGIGRVAIRNWVAKD